MKCVSSQYAVAGSTFELATICVVGLCAQKPELRLSGSIQLKSTLSLADNVWAIQRNVSN
jgi:hypothetical protein